jgi:hypothetical protein
MSNTPANASPRSGRLYANTLLTLMAGFVIAMMLDRGQGSLISVADAQHAQQPATRGGDGDDGGMVSAAEQRKVMIAELRSLNSRMEHMEAVLAKPMSVKVIDMPPIKLQDQPDRGDKDKKDDRKSDKKPS